MGSLTLRGREDFGSEPPAKICTCLLMIHHVAALIGNFASYETAFILVAKSWQEWLIGVCVVYVKF